MRCVKLLLATPLTYSQSFEHYNVCLGILFLQCDRYCQTTCQTLANNYNISESRKGHGYTYRSMSRSKQPRDDLLRSLNFISFCNDLKIFTYFYITFCNGFSLLFITLFVIIIVPLQVTFNLQPVPLYVYCMSI